MRTAIMGFNPLSHLPGEYDAGRLIRGACEYDTDKGRFYLTCSIGELAQRIAASTSPSAPAEPLEALAEECFRTSYQVGYAWGAGRMNKFKASEASEKAQARFLAALRTALSVSTEDK